MGIWRTLVGWAVKTSSPSLASSITIGRFCGRLGAATCVLCRLDAVLSGVAESDNLFKDVRGSGTSLLDPGMGCWDAAWPERWAMDDVEVGC
jgi:hypothetical protein